MGEKKNEKKEEEKKWPPAHEVLTVLLGDVIHVPTIARAYAKGMAAPVKGIPDLVSALELAKSAGTGEVRSIQKDINMSLRNLKKQLAEAKAEEQKGKSIVIEMLKKPHRTV